MASHAQKQQQLQVGDGGGKDRQRELVPADDDELHQAGEPCIVMLLPCHANSVSSPEQSELSNVVGLWQSG